LVAIGSIAAVCVINIANRRLSSGALRLLTWMKFGVLAVLAGWALAFRLGSASHFVPFFHQHAGSPPLLAGLTTALVAAFYSFGGWWDVSKIAGEIAEPHRTLPRALVIGVAGVIAAYVIVSGVFLYLVPLESVTSDQTFVAQAGQVLFGRVGASLLSGIVVLCVLGSLAALIMTAPRVYYAMACDGVFLHSVATVSASGTPARAIAIQGFMASLLVVLGNFDQILGYFIFCAVLFLGLTVGTLFIFPRRESGERSITTPLYPATPIAFLVLIITMLLLMLLRSPRQSLLGLLVVVAGLPVYRALRRKSARAEAARAFVSTAHLSKEA
jgi:APA family basic amino acid/polyamine antiporter